MKCYIRRYENGEFKEGYYKSHIVDAFNHWVFTKQEAKQFKTVSEARKEIKKYKLKKCEVEYEPKVTNKNRSRNSKLIRKIKEEA